MTNEHQTTSPRDMLSGYEAAEQANERQHTVCQTVPLPPELSQQADEQQRIGSQDLHSELEATQPEDEQQHTVSQDTLSELEAEQQPTEQQHTLPEDLPSGLEAAQQDAIPHPEKEESLFKAVLATLNLEHLPAFVSGVRKCLDGCNSVPVIGDAIEGSFNIAFPLAFDDGVQWLAKIPINGTLERWDSLSAASLKSEAQTMQLLKRETSIPLPEVFVYSATTKNILRCPYIIMSFISGTPLYDVWFDKKSSPDLVTQRRTRALQSIAAAIVQLSQFSYQTGGAITISDDGSEEIGPGRVMDSQAAMHPASRNPEIDNTPWVPAGPFANAQAFYTHIIGLYPERDTEPYIEGMRLLIRKMIGWVPEPEAQNPFALSHPDFNMQNVIVLEEGELVALIDWDGVTAEPQSLGSLRYPSWLTRDWDPAYYAYTESMDEGVEPVGVWEDSPTQLALDRATYRKAIQDAVWNDSSIDPTSLSLIKHNLYIAAVDTRDCIHLTPILEKVVEETCKIMELEVELDVYDLAIALAEGSTEEEDVAQMELLETGFTTLLQKEDL